MFMYALRSTNRISHFDLVVAIHLSSFVAVVFDIIELSRRNALRCHSSYHSGTILHSLGLQWWHRVYNRALLKSLLSQRLSCVDLKGETIGQLPIIRIEGKGTKIPEPNLDLVLRHPLARLSLLVVGRGGGTQKLFAELDIAGLLPKALLKVR